MNKNIFSICCLTVSFSLFAGDVDRFLTQQKVDVTNSSYNTTSGEAGKTYWSNKKTSDGITRERVQSGAEQVTVIRDTDYQMGKSYYKQEATTLSLEQGKSKALSNCSFHVDHTRLTNKERADKKVEGKIHSMIWGKDQERIFGTCFTVTDSICKAIKADFADPDFSKVKKELKSCQAFADKFAKATAKNETYYDDEDAAKKNINAIADQFVVMNDSKEETRQWVDFYNNLARGERESFSWKVERFGKMIDLCNQFDFVSTTKGNATKDDKKAASSGTLKLTN